MFWTFYLSFSLLLATFSRAQSTLTLTQGSASDVANSLFGQSYNLGPVSSAGMAEQIGTFSGGNAAGFGIDSGIVLSSGSLTGVSDNEQGSSDPDISGSLDAASISTTITAKDSNTHALTTFGAIFCTCENANSADSYPERARVVLDGAIVYDKSKGPEVSLVLISSCSKYSQSVLLNFVYLWFCKRTQGLPRHLALQWAIM